MAAPSGSRDALITAIQSVADASPQQGTRISLGTPGGVELVPKSDDRPTGQAWAAGSAFETLAGGIVDYLFDAFVPLGSIRYVNSGAAIPSGWQIADGTNDTPNLVGAFVKGAATAGGSGGSTNTGPASTANTGSTNPSTGSPSTTVNIADTGSGTLVASGTHSHIVNNHNHSMSHTHSGNEPPFVEMIPIIRIA